MKIIRNETIIISKKENEALDLTNAILNEMEEEACDPELLQKIADAQAALSDIYEYITQAEEWNTLLKNGHKSPTVCQMYSLSLSAPNSALPGLSTTDLRTKKFWTFSLTIKN